MRLRIKFGRHVVQDLSPFCHGLLPPEEAQRVSEHLHACRSCRAEYEEIRFGMALAGHLLPVSAPEGLWEAIEAKWREQTRPGAVPAVRRRHLLSTRAGWVLSSAASVLSLAAILIGHFPRVHRPEHPAPSAAQVDLGEYLRSVQAASPENGFQAVSSAAPRFVSWDQREALQLAGLSLSSVDAPPGCRLLAHRVLNLRGARAVQFVYASRQDSFCVFVAPREARFFLGSESAVDTEVEGIFCQKLDCPKQESYLFGEGNFHCVLVSKSLDRRQAAAVMRYFISAHRKAKEHR